MKGASVEGETPPPMKGLRVILHQPLSQTRKPLLVLAIPGEQLSAPQMPPESYSHTETDGHSPFCRGQGSS